MSIHFLGAPSGGGPFNRTFFNAVLGDLLDRAGKDRPQRLSLFLSDGTILDVCRIQELADDYVVLQTFRDSTDTCSLGLEVVPYGLIYRLQLLPKESSGDRVGFSWKPEAAARPSRPTKRISRQT